MIAQFLLIALLPAMLAAAAGWDLASFTIPNSLNLRRGRHFRRLCAVSGTFRAARSAYIFWPVSSGLRRGLRLFALGYIGGGDAKLYAGASLWLGPQDLVIYTLVATILGGLLTINAFGASPVAAARRAGAPGLDFEAA